MAEETTEEALTPDPIEGKLGELFEIDPTDTTAWTATHTILEALEFADYRFSSPRAGAMEIARVAHVERVQKEERHDSVGEEAMESMGLGRQCANRRPTCPTTELPVQPLSMAGYVLE